MSEYYDHGTFPTPNTKISSAGMRAELDAIEAGFNKLPVLTGNAGKVVKVKGDASGLETGLLDKTAVGLSNVDNTSDANKPVSTDAQTALNLKANLASPTFTGTVGGLTKAMVGLSNVDNTSDASKPVSTATQTALDLKAASVHGHIVGDVTGLQTALDGKAAASHGHTIANVTGLQAALDGKQAYDADTAKLDVAQAFTAPQRSALLTDNDGSFDLSAKQNFKCTTAGSLTLTFTGQADGLSGSVIFVNTSNHAIAAHANTKLTTADLTKLSASGTYRIDFISDGTNAYCSVVGSYA